MFDSPRPADSGSEDDDDDDFQDAQAAGPNLGPALTPEVEQSPFDFRPSWLVPATEMLHTETQTPGQVNPIQEAISTQTDLATDLTGETQHAF